MSLPSSAEQAPTTALPPDTGRPLAPPGSTRRVFLASTGVLALGATAAATTLDGIAADVSRTASSPAGGGLEMTDLGAGTLVAYIRPGESEVTIMTGDREVVVDDPALARAIARASTREAGTR